MKIYKIIPESGIRGYGNYSQIASVFSNQDWENPNFDVFDVYITDLTNHEWESLCNLDVTTAIPLPLEDRLAIVTGNVCFEKYLGMVANTANLILANNPEGAMEKKSVDKTMCGMLGFDILTSLSIEKAIKQITFLSKIRDYARYQHRSNYITEIFFLNPDKKIPFFLVSETERTARLQSILLS